MTLTEDDYLKAIRTSDPRGIRELYRAFLPRISRFITLNGGSSEDAKDVFQDALVIIYRKAKEPDFTLTSQFYTLLYGVCRNLWGNQLQKKSRTEVSLTDDHKFQVTVDISKDIEAAEEQRLFWDAFRELGEDCQSILRLFFAREKMEAIAQKLNLSSVGYAKKKKIQV